MRLKTLIAGCAALGAAGCATPGEDSVIDRETKYRLESVDGRPAGARSFTLSFDRSGSYNASFDCAEHFGRFTLGSRLDLEPGGTAPGACDQLDLGTGGPVAREESFGAQFLRDRPFAVSRNGAVLELRGRRHRYMLVSPSS